MARACQYQPNIRSRLLRCRLLFDQLMQILPAGWPQCDEAVYSLPAGGLLTIKLALRTKYTWQLEIQYLSTQKATQSKLSAQVYLDAQLAETIAFNAQPVIIGPRLYPNDTGRYPDEKNQMDNLLLEWLFLLENE